MCESGKRQSSFLCPRGTIFNQKHRVCDWWYNVKCEDATEFYDLNLDLLLLDKGVSSGSAPQTSLNVPPVLDALSGSADDVEVFDSDDEDIDLLGNSDIEELDAMLEELGLTSLLTSGGASEWDLQGTQNLRLNLTGDVWTDLLSELLLQSRPKGI